MGLSKISLRHVIMKSVVREKKSPRQDPVSSPVLFVRSDSHTAEVIHPPSSPINDSSSHSRFRDNGSEKTSRRRLLGKLRPVSAAFTDTAESTSKSKPKSPSTFRVLSRHLHRRKTQTSEKVPINMPDIEIITEQIEKSVEKRINEIRSEWEKRATLLAKANEESQRKVLELEEESATGKSPNSSVSKKDIKPALCMAAAKETGDTIQEAIRLHEAGELESSTLMFGRLAELPGENNNLSRLLYGLSLRHGWGCTPDPINALRYLSAAASGAALIEDSALKAGKKRGGPARGELVLAIFELANCFRHGWGLPVDEVAAKQYYETAANLGDTDAMNEVAQCYVEGFGCTKDKFAAARYYRMAEREGSKTLGNSWIWKEKYDLPNKVTFKE